MNDFFSKERLLLEGRNNLISNDIIHELRPHRAGVTKIVHLDRRWPTCKNAEPITGRISFQVNRDIDVKIMQ